MNTINQDDIIDRLGAEDWQQVEDTFSGMNAKEIYYELNDLFETDNNISLAQDIYYALTNQRVYLVSR